MSTCALQSLVLFATLQQAHAAQDAFAQLGPGGTAATSLVSIPLHQPLVVTQPTAPGQQQYMPGAAQPAVAPLPPEPHEPSATQAVPQAYAPLGASVPQAAAQQLLPPQPMTLPQQLPLPQHQMASQQQQREAVTMRPLYAGPRPAYLVRM